MNPDSVGEVADEPQQNEERAELNREPRRTREDQFPSLEGLGVGSPAARACRAHSAN
jgi:hypothetical protein